MLSLYTRPSILRSRSIGKLALGSSPKHYLSMLSVYTRPSILRCRSTGKLALGSSPQTLPLHVICLHPPFHSPLPLYKQARTWQLSSNITSPCYPSTPALPFSAPALQASSHLATLLKHYLSMLSHYTRPSILRFRSTGKLALGSSPQTLPLRVIPLHPPFHSPLSLYTLLSLPPSKL
ncbi:hypothetical protein PoB_000776200 [Plakobranchus ocellatus]|uniref:Uncharacterized protein n=1 Tax=Plakobranchus ocellatus TaxID=259542 RepID=A0AAV3YEF9_9GAST|nr:hypothetical protein PoB_000776200 [Plakobranchus ocellatus]